MSNVASPSVKPRDDHSRGQSSRDQHEHIPSESVLSGRDMVVEKLDSKDTIVVAESQDADTADHDLDLKRPSFASRYDSPTTSFTPSSEQLPLPAFSSLEAKGDDNTHAYQLENADVTAGKHKNRYMVDGKIVNGRGLGRGRPGIKRGPRKSRLTNELMMDEDNHTPISTPERREVSASASSKSKRKRRDSDSSVVRIEPDDASSSLRSRSSTPEYNPNAYTRSGRPSQKPPSLASPTTNSISAGNSTAGKQAPTPSSSAAASKTRKHPKIKPKLYRGREAFALCEHCLRGISPPSNPIVFCDACNKCWHQQCHDPRIPPSVLTDSRAEWFCGACDRILHGKKKTPKAEKPKVTPLDASHTRPEEISYGQPLLTGNAITASYKKKYLQTLPRQKLIDLVLHASAQAPHLALFESQMTAAAPVLHSAPTYTSSYVTPVDPKPYNLATNNPKTKELHEDEGYEDDGLDEFAILYPKPGEGVKLPPERDDLDMLLEGPDSCTFSHWITGMEVKTTVAVR